MPAYKTGKKTLQYSNDFKVGAVELSFREGATVKGVAGSLGIHPYMLSRWRKEFREGDIVKDKRKRSLSKSSPKQKDRLAELERQNEQLRLENDLLKKWQQFAALENRQNSDS